jgi:endonuclease/exonuclease/phosphatase family metal-dependent hydrolase
MPRIDSVLLSPLYQEFTLGAKLVRPFVPAHFDQWRTPLGEIIHRLGVFLALLILSPFACVSVILGGTARIFTHLSRESFTHNKSNLVQESIAPQDLKIQTLKIRTLNTALMPEFIVAYKGLKPSAERAPDLVKELEKTRDDIVCLQEVFNESESEKVADGLKSYPHKIFDVAPRYLGLSSGLMIASKYPLDCIHFYPHPVMSGFDQLANKGVLATTVLLPNDRYAFLFNTHFNGGKRQIKEREWKDLDDIVTHYHTKMKSEEFKTKLIVKVFIGTFICGDFNLNLDEMQKASKNYNIKNSLTNSYQEYGEIVKNMPSSLKDKGTTLINLNYLADGENPQRNDRRLDHIFFKPADSKNSNGELPQAKENWLNKVSDHTSIEVEVKL